jgi:hypothetical protein
MACIEGEGRRGEPTAQSKLTEQHKPQQEGGNGSPGLPSVHQRAKPPPEKIALNRAVERTRALYERNGWVFLPLGEAGQTSPSLSKLKGEQWPQPEPQEHANPMGESKVSKLSEEKENWPSLFQPRWWMRCAPWDEVYPTVKTKISIA